MGDNRKERRREKGKGRMGRWKEMGEEMKERRKEKGKGRTGEGKKWEKR